MTEEAYIGQVLSRMPRGMPLRNQVAMELHAHIAEGRARGQPLEEILAQLGNPEQLAESYLSAVPLVSFPLGRRLLAKLADWVIALLAVSPLFFACWLFICPDVPVVILLCVVELGAGFLVLGVYTIVAEAAFDRTVGKAWLGARVVRESGTRIGVGQAIVRQLPILLDVFWIDALFMLFTDRKQRAFELLSKTRVVQT